MIYDEVMLEVWANRDAYAKKFNYDIEAIFKDLKEFEATCGHPLVSLPPRRVKTPPALKVIDENVATSH